MIYLPSARRDTMMHLNDAVELGYGAGAEGSLVLLRGALVL